MRRTFEEWLEGKGGEDRQELFSADFAACLDGRGTPEQLERMRYAFDLGNV